MSTIAPTDNGTEVESALRRLDVRERAISRRRRRLHERIDHIYLSAPLTPTQVAELDELEAWEQRISGRRRKLHRDIDELRAKIGLPRWRDRDELENPARSWCCEEAETVWSPRTTR